jgi:molybdopterin/thiamine biosynthesis adenylyltransferase
VLDGRLFLDARVQHRGQDVDVRIAYAAEHPFVTPTVTSREGVLDRHQAPGQENFCLDREDAPWWTPQHTAADLLDHLRALLEAESEGTMREREADMPEPVTGHLAYASTGVIVISEPLLAATLERNHGTLQLVGSRRQPQLYAAAAHLGSDGPAELIGGAELRRLGISGGLDRFRVRWREITVPAGRPGFYRVLEELRETFAPLIVEARARPKRNVQRRTVWAAVTFMQEGPRRGEQERAWVFARLVVPIGGDARKRDAALVRTQALSRTIRRLRTRELNGLERTRFLVVGAGAVGGHVAVELARAGVEGLDIVDQDHYDLNNGVRHVLPASYAGREKADAVAEFARQCSPFTEARGHMIRVGTTPFAKQQLLALIASSSVVVDATGSETVTRLLHWRCAEAGVPLVSGALTPGGLGARIVVLRGASPCLDCFYDDRSIPARDSARVSGTTPHGCSHPAASCAPFEVSELAVNLARTAVRCVPRLAYPPLDFEWAVLNFRRPEQRWTQGFLAAQSNCPSCSAAG